MSEVKEEMVMNSVVAIDISRVLLWSGKTIRVFGTQENPWFHGADVAKALGYSNTTDGISHAKPHQKCTGDMIIRDRNQLPYMR
jgi:prophage antirepressor-like protein